MMLRSVVVVIDGLISLIWFWLHMDLMGLIWSWFHMGLIWFWFHMGLMGFNFFFFFSYGLDQFNLRLVTSVLVLVSLF